MKTTIYDALTQYMIDNGLFESQAETVMQKVVAHSHEADTSLPDMKNRWYDEPEGYPPSIMAILRISVNRFVIQWMDAESPMHWARPMFLP